MVPILRVSALGPQYNASQTDSVAARTKALLLEIARNHKYVMADPKPLATFEGFGDSTLNFVLRCYLPNLEHRLLVIHELHAEIHRVFAEEGIEIAFPQRDLNIRSVDPLVASLAISSQEKQTDAIRSRRPRKSA